MMEYYLRNVAPLPDPKEDNTVLEGIPDWRRDYILKYMRPCDRKLSLGVWMLLEDALRQHGFSADKVIVGANGKPECKGIYFNVSHSGEFALCAVSDAPVGCDVEKVTDAPMEIAERYFSERECQYIEDATSVEDRNRRFFRLWTMKESYVKMTGEGMGVSPDRVEIDLDTLTVYRDSIPQSCMLKNLSHEDYEITLVVCRKIRSATSG